MKFRQRGFTLVELLVVIAIIAILSAIVVPGVTGYIKQSRMTKAIAEINGIETQLVKIMSDAGRSSLQHLFDPEAVNQHLFEQTSGQLYDGNMHLTAAALAQAKDLYTNTLYGLLRAGRGILHRDEAYPFPPTASTYPSSRPYRDFLNESIVKQLGTSYLDIGFDPWGEMYNIYPGPWPRGSAQEPDLIPFRTYRDTEGGSQRLPGSRRRGADRLTITVLDPEIGEDVQVGFPAPYDAVAYIWSEGENLTSGQAELRSVAQGRLFENAYLPQDPMLKGGGDDINNWDKTQSYSLFY